MRAQPGPLAKRGSAAVGRMIAELCAQNMQARDYAGAPHQQLQLQVKMLPPLMVHKHGRHWFVLKAEGSKRLPLP